MSEAGQGGFKPGFILDAGVKLALSESEYRLFRDLIYEQCGISFGPEKRAFMESRLRRCMEEAEMKTPGEYYNLLVHSPGRNRELFGLLDALMIGETSFFRNQPQFDLFRQVILPELITAKEKAGQRTLNIWSAGCSTGQEPYSIVMTLLDGFPQLQTWQLHVHATDLSFTALEAAQQGSYKLSQVKGVEESYLNKYFRREQNQYVITPAVSRHVIFDYHNLRQEPRLHNLDVIFCRNVMIYFTREDNAQLVERFANSLYPQGWLVIGHAESLSSISNRFTMIHLNRGIAYKLGR